MNIVIAKTSSLQTYTHFHFIPIVLALLVLYTLPRNLARPVHSLVYTILDPTTERHGIILLVFLNGPHLTLRTTPIKLITLTHKKDSNTNMYVCVCLSLASFTD